MPENRPAAPPELPFRRPMPVARLRRDDDTPFRISAEEDEKAALARFLGVDRIDRLSFAGMIHPAPSLGFRIRGHLVAKIEQTCVVSLEPVRSRHDIDVERLYLPADRIAPARETHVLHDEEDGPDPYGDALDPAELAVETLALAIDPYPRAAGARLANSVLAEPEDDEDDTPHPFASLVALRRGSGGTDG